MTWVERPYAVALLGVLTVLTPTLSYQQAAGIVRPPEVPDGKWIERQCESIGKQGLTDDARGRALEKAKEACGTYEASPNDQSARDAWIRTMLALQDDVGPAAMRTFVPDFGGELPADLDSYSLFLIPDDRWRGNDFADERESLWSAFFSFGRSIGDSRAAIWFLDHEDNVDVLRSQDYCRQFGLNYNGGPYVVTMRRRPDLLKAGDEIVVIRMGGIAPGRVLSILNRLSRDLTTTGRAGTGMLVYEELKQRIVTLVESYPEGARAFVSTVLGL